MIYIQKGKENTVVTDWYSTTNPVLLDIKIDGKFIETIQPFYQNGTLVATLNIPDETEAGEWLISWGDLKTELVTVLSDSVIVKKKYTKEIIQKQYGNN